ncbi:MAG: LytTR family DNA-binding domain-containing protein [Bacteroidetes bacterium]|nr:LytTR family DNA-binding domain-containing protein [Bacteroidota bacterium]
MSTAIIIDDEQPAREIIKHYLKSFPEIELLGDYPDGFSGLKAIQELKPDIVFLDIQMPKLTGFELLELLDEPPHIIFSTAYDQYAIKAFEMTAVDYLLKPYSSERFAQAIKKVQLQILTRKTEQPAVNNLVAALESNPEFLERIAVKTRKKIEVIPVNEISHIEADDDYVTIHTGTEKYLKEKTMKYMESHLDPAQFVRVHRSYIVNVNHIARLELYEKETYHVLLKNGTSIRASSTGYKELKQLLHL